MAVTLRSSIQDKVRDLIGFGSQDVDLSRPDGDAGLFGPGSAAWTVHADFTSMMVGGIAALLLQMLHPSALAGVWDHSDVRRDRAGRLRRTAMFITVTTYGSTVEASRWIDRVRTIHARVGGVRPDGVPYRADDPRLLTFVHAAEVRCFLTAYLLYRNPAFAGGAQDRYVAEMAELARRLGAEDVPESVAALDSYLEAMRDELRYDARTRAVSCFLLDQKTDDPALAPVAALMRAAAGDVLPPWAARLHGFGRGRGGRPGLVMGTRGLGSMLRWALRNGSAARAEAVSA